jgi:hypothetical protein
VLHVGSKREVIAYLDQQTKPLEWRVCRCLVLKKFKNGNDCFHFLAVMLLQYMFIKPVLVLLLFLSIHKIEKSESGDRNLRNIQTLTKTLSLVSLIIALAALLQFYRSIFSALRSYQWLAQRFLCIKLLVFLVTVQKIVVAMAMNEFPSDPRNEESPAVRLYLIILLIEAPIYALILHRYFGYSQYNTLDEGEEKLGMDRPKYSIALWDVLCFHRLLQTDRELSSSSSSASVLPSVSKEDSSLVPERKKEAWSMELT